MRVAICDDESRNRAGIRSILESAFKNVEISDYASGQALVEAVKNGYMPDIVLLDIAMEGMDGMETARKLRGISDVLLIFVTGVKEQVFDAFDVGAFHYLLKPVEKKRLLEVMERAFAEIEKTSARNKFMLIKVAGGCRRVNIADILYAESNGRKVILHMKQEKLEFYDKMEELEKELGGAFYRCHRSYLVSLAEVKGYDNMSITMSNGEVVYLSKRKYSDFVQTYCRFLQDLQ